ncbi:MAG: hypothetical protein HYY52_04680 [Candidatus Melainabacteria bacterium]|nr:hypothetical protein [Candidatus Melainabacteria bacterium]
MSGLESNLSMNLLQGLKGYLSKGNESNNLNQQQDNKPIDQVVKNIKDTQTTSRESLINTNSNVLINQPVQESPLLNQSVLNNATLIHNKLTMDVRVDLNKNPQALPSPSQLEFHGPSDLPAYAGVPNMSLKSWISEHNNKNFAKLETEAKELRATNIGIKGFLRQNYQGFDSGTESKNRNKNLIILSHIFSPPEQSGYSNTELLVNICNFKKLGPSLKKEENSGKQDNPYEEKLLPPLPLELIKLSKVDLTKVKCLCQLFALPREFPECLRLFAKEVKDKLEINDKDFNLFFMQRLKFVQERSLGQDKDINSAISSFTQLLNQENYPVLLPLVLLYYPLPLPYVRKDIDFVTKWKKKDPKTKDVYEAVVASCEIYYVSKTTGRFLLKFQLNNKDEFSFNIETSSNNKDIVNELERAITESMTLFEYPPLLTDLNVLLTKEIYKATDIDEEVAIVSNGPMRLEIILAVYSALIVLNKHSKEINPQGIIDVVD